MFVFLRQDEIRVERGGGMEEKKTRIAVIVRLGEARKYLRDERDTFRRPKKSVRSGDMPNAV